jgi:hypothetical protein
MWFFKKFIQQKTLKKLFYVSWCSSQILNASFSSSYSNSGAKFSYYPLSSISSDFGAKKYSSSEDGSEYFAQKCFSSENEFQYFDQIKDAIKRDPDKLLDYYPERYRIGEKELSKIYLMGTAEASLEKKEKEINKEEKKLGEEQPATPEEQRIIDSLKRNNRRLKDEINEMREAIKNKSTKQKEEFDKATEKLSNENDNPKTNTIFEFVESFFAYLQFAKKEDILSIQKQSKEEANSNLLAQAQRKFTESIGRIANNPQVDKIVSDVLKENIPKAASFLNHIVYTPAWEEETQLELIKHLNILKDSTIRCGFGCVHEGSADSRSLIPLVSYRFSIFSRAKIVDLPYGFRKDYDFFTNYLRKTSIKDFGARDYPDTIKIGEDKLKVFPKVIEEMKKKDQEWCRLDKFYDSSFFKSTVPGLAEIRKLLADMYQSHASISIQIKQNCLEFNGVGEFLQKVILENTLLFSKDILFTVFRIFLIPIEIFDFLLY